MYKALYRKYRPLTFDDVVSQPHITRTLLNQLISGKTAHAYLFTGSRGTGKTTCARILAKALNCEHTKDGNPCLECDICRDADSGMLSDIIEIDAASNNGVNDVRELREAAIYTPERCRYRVYIIDEVHMLSKDAFNALLKIMEEPPAHVKFILATTEIHKVLPTILSRCQRFDFHRIREEDIKSRLLYVAEKESISLTDAAAQLIAKAADGGMRDALSLLDQCIAFSENVTEEVVAEAAGIADRSYLFEIIEAAADHDPAKAADVVRRLYELSKDMQKLCEELILQFRNLMLAKSVPENPSLLECMPSETAALQQLAEKFTLEDIFGKLDMLQSCSERLARVTAKRVEIEMCMIKLCSSASNSSSVGAAIDNSEIYAKIDMLERKLNSAPIQPARKEQPVSRPAAAEKANTPAEAKSDAPKFDMADFKPVEQWAEILEAFAEVCPPASGALSGSYAEENQGYMRITIENDFFISLMKRQENFDKLKDAITRVTGKTYGVKVVRSSSKAENNETGESPLQNILKKAQDSGIATESK